MSKPLAVVVDYLVEGVLDTKFCRPGARHAVHRTLSLITLGALLADNVNHSILGVLSAIFCGLSAGHAGQSIWAHLLLTTFTIPSRTCCAQWILSLVLVTS